MILLVTMGFLVLNGCTQKPDVSALLKNDETKAEIFNAITNDDDYMMGFMENMQTSEQAMQLMQGNQKMMGTMMQGGGMRMAMNDSTMMKIMMQQMMTDSNSMNSMMKMMKNKGMINNKK